MSWECEIFNTLLMVLLGPFFHGNLTVYEGLIEGLLMDHGGQS